MITQKQESRVFLIGGVAICIVALLTLLPHMNKKKEDTTQKAEVKKIEPLNYKKITPGDLYKKLAFEGQNIVFIDIRSQTDFNIDHIIGSQNIPITEFNKFDSNLFQNKIIIIIDSAENRENISLVDKTIKSTSPNQEYYVLYGGYYMWKNTGGRTLDWGDPSSFVNHNKIRYITAEKLEQKLTENKNLYQIIDVREKAQFEKKHIPDAENIPLKNLEKNHKKIHNQKETIAYGQNFIDSFQAGSQLYDLGFPTVIILEDGFDGWQKHNEQKVIQKKPEEKTKDN